MNRIQVSMSMEGLGALSLTAEDGFTIADGRSMSSDIHQTVKEGVNSEITCEFNTYMNQEIYDLLTEYGLRCWNSKNITDDNFFTVTIKYIAQGVVQKTRTFNRCVTKTPLDHIADFDKGAKVMLKVSLSLNKEQGIDQFTHVLQ